MVKVIALCILLTVCTSNAKKNNLPVLTVFIHGTFLPVLALASPSWFFKGEVTNDALYNRALEQLRKKSNFFENHPMANEGFNFIEHEKLDSITADGLSENEARCAIYFFISAYRSVARASGFDADNDSYAMFGWSGMNSQKARYDAGLNLYQSLTSLTHKYREIRLITYSHGGNVALNLYEAELLHKKKLSIDLLVMLGVPIQIETARALRSPFFKTIASLRSEGDLIQNTDRFSTLGHESFSKMGDLVSLGSIMSKNEGIRRIDGKFIINDDDGVIDHFNLYQLGAKQIHPLFGKLPVAILVPSFMQQILINDQTNIECHVTIGDKIQTYIKADDYDWYPPSRISQNFINIVSFQSNLVNDKWKPGHSHLQSSMEQTYSAIKELFS